MSDTRSQRKYRPQSVSSDVNREDGIDLWAYLKIIRRRWLFICLNAILAVGIAAFITLRLTKIYRATCTIRIETQAPKVLGRDVEAVDEMGTGSFWSNAEYYQTQYKIIESRDVSVRVVKAFSLHQDPTFLQIPPDELADFEPVSEDVAAQVLQADLTVEPVKDSRLVKIHVDHPSPERAMLLSNAVANAYVDKNLESILQSTVDAVDWLSDQLDDARQKLAASEEAAYHFKKDNGILSVSLEERQNMLTAQMTAVATKLTEAKANRIILAARKSAMAEAAKSDDPMAIPLESINDSPLIQKLKQEYGKMTQSYSELSQRYGAKYPKMLETEAKLVRIKSDIEREVRNILQSVDAELEAAKKTEAGLFRTLEDLRAQALALSEKAVTFGRLERDRENNERIYQLLLGRSKEADLSKLLRVNNVHVLDAALLPERPIEPRLHINLAIGVIVGLFIGLFLALVMELMDRTIKNQEDIENLEIPFLGIVPSIEASGTYSMHNGPPATTAPKGRHVSSKKEDMNIDRFVDEYPQSQVAESLRAIRTNLLFMSADRPAQRILVTSPSPEEGKTTVAINLAIVMAQSGARVLLVDSDMRRPRVHRAFTVRPVRGLSTVVLGTSTLAESVYRPDIDNLEVLLCGPTPPNPAELMHTARFQQVMDDISKLYDHVVFDSPPIAVVTDAAILSKMVDGTVLVVKSLKTTRDAASHAVSLLKDIDATILGAVLNNINLASRKYGQYYYYHRNQYCYSDEPNTASSVPELAPARRSTPDDETVVQP